MERQKCCERNQKDLHVGQRNEMQLRSDVCYDVRYENESLDG